MFTLGFQPKPTVSLPPSAARTLPWEGSRPPSLMRPGACPASLSPLRACRGRGVQAPTPRTGWVPWRLWPLLPS